VPEPTHSEVTRSFAATDPPIPSQPLVVALGLDQSLQSDSFRTIYLENANDAPAYLRDRNSTLLVLGSRLTSAQALQILRQCSTEHPTSTAATIVLCAGPEPELFQKFVDEGMVYYLARKEIPLEQLRPLVASCIGRSAKKAQFEDRQELHADNVQNADQLLDLSVRLPMQTNIPSAAALVLQKLRESIEANYVQCFIYDAEEDTLTPADALENKEVSYSAASGLTAFAARTCDRVILDRVGADPRYDADIDNPIGTGDAHFIAEPILGN
jgi:DNA-binding response OmpR family regulator